MVLILNILIIINYFYKPASFILLYLQINNSLINSQMLILSHSLQTISLFLKLFILIPNYCLYQYYLLIISLIIIVILLIINYTSYSIIKYFI